MVTQIRVTGLKEVQNFMNKLPIKVKEKVGKEGTIKLATNLRGRIRRRYTMAGYGKGLSSGYGFKSIVMEPTSNGAKIEILAPWLTLLEQGVRDHLVSPYTIRKHLESPGSTMFQKAPKGEWGGKPIMWHWKGPFVEPAMMSFKPEIPRLLTQFIKQAIREARR